LGLARRVIQVLALTALACGIAPADTIIAGRVDATRGQFNAWIRADGTESVTYSADVLELEIASDDSQMRGALSAGLFTKVNMDRPLESCLSLDSQINPASAAAALERIESKIPVNDGELAAAQGSAAAQAVRLQTVPAPPALAQTVLTQAVLAQNRGLKQHGRQSE